MELFSFFCYPPALAAVMILCGKIQCQNPKMKMFQPKTSNNFFVGPVFSRDGCLHGQDADRETEKTPSSQSRSQTVWYRFCFCCERCRASFSTPESVIVQYHRVRASLRALVAQLDAHPTIDQVAGLTPTGLATFFRGDFDLQLLIRWRV